MKIDGEKQDGIKLEGIGLDGAETGGDSCDSGCDDQGWMCTVATGSAWAIIYHVPVFPHYMSSASKELRVLRGR